ncbi:MAG TPA: methyl-accepting chemotaxis protein [Burkholderiaceae bacterium]|nr:methyl-accepting chemotaxis protein [Burkholderiaceae bacterium]
MLKNLTIKTRLVVVIAFLSLELIFGAVVGIAGLYFANASMQSMYGDRLVCLGQLDQVVRLLSANQTNAAKALTAPPEKVTALLDEIDANIKQVGKVWGEYTATELTPDEERLATQAAAARATFLQQGLLPVVAAMRAGDQPKAQELVQGRMEQTFVPLRRAIDDLIALQLNVARDTYQTSEQRYQWIRNWCLAGVVAGLILAAVIGYWLVQAITVPLNEAVELAGAIAGGDLTRTIVVRGNDETGRLMAALQKMNASLVSIVGQVRSGTDTIATATGEIAAGNQDLSSRTEEQASSLQETAASMEQLTATVKQNTEYAVQASTLAESASAVAARGGEVIGHVVGTMDEISDSAHKITDIIGVIDSIAFQTNILALNAAVEAARAGEQGRGFAVVASEVRSLAHRSADAAKQIKALIGASVERVEAGSQYVSAAGDTMRDIVNSVRKVSDIIGDITLASKEQSSGIEQISIAISQMDQVTQQNAALVEQAAAASEAMQSQAGRLSQVVGLFKLDAAGRADKTPATLRLTASAA